MSHPSRAERFPHPSEGGAKEADPSLLRTRARRILPPLSLLLGLSAVITVLVAFPLSFSPAVYAPGDIARKDVKASRDFLVPDPNATEKRRREAELSSPAVYDFSPNVLAETLAALKQDLNIGEASAAKGEGAKGPEREATIENLESRWKVAVPKSVVHRLLEPGGGRALIDGVAEALRPLYARGVVDNKRLLLNEEKRRIVLRNVATRAEISLEEPDKAEDFNEARKSLTGGSGADPLKAFARQLAGALLRPNFNFNSEETSARRAAARDGAKPALYQIRRGEMLVREGDRVSAEQARRLEVHAQLAQGEGVWRRHAGLLLLAALSLYIAYRFGKDNVKKFRRAMRDVLFLSSLLVLTIATERALLMVATALAAAVPGGAQAALSYAVPVSSAAIVVRVVLNSESALMFSLPAFALAALPYPQSLGAFFCFSLGGLAAAHVAARTCHRIDFLKAGMCAAFVQAAAVGCFALFDGAETALWSATGAFLGGATGGVVALCLVPLAEWAFGYTTDIRLLELGSLDHPLLRDLMLRAPGTYHHSIVTGSLAKAAAEAIGARALLATVAAYYHDIGKISKPAYYIENQAEGRNPHDKLAPSMSSLILISHAKEGVDLAHKNSLGRDIADIVQQHHGTSLIRFFYEKACQLARQGVDLVGESDYRYPGPKPQTREAALVLLADAVEAAARTIPDPRPAKIRGVVQNIVNRTFTDGQLDECDLTLKDLHQIAHSFSRILCAIHHQRIDYPLAAEKRKTPDGDLDSKRVRDHRDRRTEAADTRGERLRRLGM